VVGLSVEGDREGIADSFAVQRVDDVLLEAFDVEGDRVGRKAQRVAEMTDRNAISQRAQGGLPTLEAELCRRESILRNTGAACSVEHVFGHALRDQHEIALNI